MAMHHAGQMFAGGGETQIVVTRGVHQYVIYDSAIRVGRDREGHRPLQFASGLMVLQGGTHLTDVNCRPSEANFIDSKVVAGYMPSGEYVWHKGMGPASLPPITRR